MKITTVVRNLDGKPDKKEVIEFFGFACEGQKGWRTDYTVLDPNHKDGAEHLIGCCDGIDTYMIWSNSPFILIQDTRGILKVHLARKVGKNGLEEKILLPVLPSECRFEDWTCTMFIDLVRAVSVFTGPISAEMIWVNYFELSGDCLLAISKSDECGIRPCQFVDRDFSVHSDLETICISADFAHIVYHVIIFERLSGVGHWRELKEGGVDFL